MLFGLMLVAFIQNAHANYVSMDEFKSILIKRGFSADDVDCYMSRKVAAKHESAYLDLDTAIAEIKTSEKCFSVGHIFFFIFILTSAIVGSVFLIAYFGSKGNSSRMAEAI